LGRGIITRRREVKIGSYHELLGPFFTNLGTYKFMITANPFLLIIPLSKVLGRIAGYKERRFGWTCAGIKYARTIRIKSRGIIKRRERLRLVVIMNSWVKRLREKDPQVHDNHQLSSCIIFPSKFIERIAGYKERRFG
jgi:hypothetical protein